VVPPDDNFVTIMRAVSEGRKLCDNLLKYVCVWELGKWPARRRESA
jgi:hypothetical protein